MDPDSGSAGAITLELHKLYNNKAVIWRTLYLTTARYSVTVAANAGRSVPELRLSAVSSALDVRANATSGIAAIAATVLRTAAAEGLIRQPGIRADKACRGLPGMQAPP